MWCSLKGFVEGTRNVTTPDRIKPWDHRRDKRKCLSYYNEFCTYYQTRCGCSSHCDYYNDGQEIYIPPSPPDNNYKTLKTLMGIIRKFEEQMLNTESLEGKCFSGEHPNSIIGEAFIKKSGKNKYSISKQN